MATAKHCIECGAPLPGTSAGGLCPACALRGALSPGDGGELEDQGPEAASGGRREEVGNQRLPIRGPGDFGDYELLEQIGRGGMGIVYRARQKSLDRIVALKLLLFGPQASPDFAKRFRAEAVLAAGLQHPNIVAIHEVGVHEGQQFFAMDYVAGPSLAQLVGQQPLPARRAARYLKTIAEAIHYAHERGILHRDLKPSNVLIDENDQPRVTDFGLAKQLTPASDSTVQTSHFTVTGQVLGSPSYIPPEQALGKRGKLSRQSDVYALGAMLYHLLTGRPPFQGETLAETLQHVLNTEPVPLRVLNASVPRDLETICLKCLEKEPARRYASAQAVTDELDRVLEKKPIFARPVGIVGKTVRWCRRKPALAVALGAVVLVGAVGLAGVLWQWRAAVQARARIELENYDAAIAEAQLAIEQNRFDRARPILAREDNERHRGWEWGWLQRQCNLDLMTLTHKKQLECASFSPDGRYVVTGGMDLIARLWELATGQEIRRFPGHEGWIVTAEFSPDGRLLVTASLDGTARVWDPAPGDEMLKLSTGAGVTEAAFSPDGKTIATTSAYAGVKLWNAQDGALLPMRYDYDLAVWSVSFSPDGRWLAYAGGPPVFDQDGDSRVVLVNRSTGEQTNFVAHRQQIRRVRFSPDSMLLVTASLDGTARLWNVDTRQEVRPLQMPVANESLSDAGFSPDGRWLAVAGAGWLVGRTHIFEVATGQVVRNLKGHSMIVPCIKFSPDGTRLVTASFDGTARVWSAAGLPEFVSLEGHDLPVWTIAFSKDGSRVATGGLDLTARVWDAETGDPLATLNVGFPVVSLAFSPKGNRLVTPGPDHTACIWALPSNLGLSGSQREAAPVQWPSGVLSRGAFGVRRLSAPLFPGSTLSPEGPSAGRTLRSAKAALKDAALQTLARPGRLSGPIMSRNLSAAGLELKTDQSGLTSAATDAGPVRLRGHTGSVMSVAWSADGRWILTGAKDGTARLWDAANGTLLRTVAVHTNRVFAVAFSPDGRRFATGAMAQKARIWETATGRLLHELSSHGGFVPQVAFSPDGRQVATGGNDGRACLWDADSGELLFTLEGHRNGISSLAFSPDGMRLATVAGGATLSALWVGETAILLWDLHTGQRLLKLDPHPVWAIAVAFSPDGQRLATSGGDNTVRIREAFPWKSEDYAGDPSRPLGEKVEDFKRSYWQKQLRLPDGATALGTRSVRPGRRWQSVATSEVNLAAERGTKRQPALAIPPRPAEAETNLLDLTASYNAALTETWLPCLGLVDVDVNLSSLPAGVTNLAGVSFDVRGLIRLSCSSIFHTMFPTNVEIAVGHRFRRLHVLHGAAMRVQQGRQIGTYRLHYRDGTSTDLPILYGRDLGGALGFDDNQAQASAAALAWSGNADTTKPVPTPVHLYRRNYENPRPDLEVVSVTFESAMTSAGPFLVALTVEP